MAYLGRPDEAGAQTTGQVAQAADSLPNADNIAVLGDDLLQLTQHIPEVCWSYLGGRSQASELLQRVSPVRPFRGRQAVPEVLAQLSQHVDGLSKLIWVDALQPTAMTSQSFRRWSPLLRT